MPGRPLRDLLADSAQLSRDGFVPFAAVAAAGIVPGFLVVMAALWVTGFTSRESVAAAARDGQFARVGLLLAAGVTGKLVNAAAFVALLLAVSSRDEGLALGTGEAFARAKERVVPFLLAELRALSWTLAGLLLLVVPGVVLAVRYCLVHLAVVLEKREGAEALRRSSEIVRARTGKVVGNLLAAAALACAAAYGANALLALCLGALGAMVPGQASFLERQALALLGELVNGLAAIWMAAFSVLLYKDLVAEDAGAHAEA